MSGLGPIFLRSLLDSAASQGVQPLSNDTSSEKDSSGSLTKSASTTGLSDFETTLKAIITPDAQQNVSEEELFSAIVTERVGELKGADVLEQFKALVTKNQASGKRGEYIPFEVAAKQALREMRDSGTLTAAEADKIYAQSFEAAQLDADATALWDDHAGGPSDVTIAVMNMTEAIAKAKAKIQSFDDGKATAGVRSVDEAEARPSSSMSGLESKLLFGGGGAMPSSLKGDVTYVPKKNRFDAQGGQGFLFKPIGENSKKLVVLIPEEMVGYSGSVNIRNEAGKIIERGREQVGTFGEIRKYNFKKPGARYPKNVTVEITLNDGSVKSYKIPDPAKRYD